ncbi:cyclin-dependent kinase inhibitor 1D isoform X2 [Kryptolebias marmoratus]|uniref:Cyclin-dependent kinase inhibitor 1-like n=2 Tax=Kryptolebias marmoratus TaxID=37003 RepID=A0A3Q3EDN4_KRYMA|nr:cyclin-dependent kinase inhibitor 1D isoform X2 [Kryptolebias marmoratus]
MAATSASTGGSEASGAELSPPGGAEASKVKAAPVRRNLFGPVDHQQLQQDFQRLLCMSVEVANKRWNFDFQRDRPGEGASIQWAELRCQDVPAFYRSCSVRPGARRRASTSSVSSSGEGSPVSSSSSGSGDEYLEVTTRGRYSIQRPQKRRQSAITDFFKVKKSRLLHSKASSRQ